MPKQSVHLNHGHKNVRDHKPGSHTPPYLEMDNMAVQNDLMQQLCGYSKDQILVSD